MSAPLDFCNFQMREYQIYRRALEIERAHTLSKDRNLYDRTINDMAQDVRELKFSIRELRRRNER